MFHSVLWYVSMCDVDSDLKVKEKAFSPTLTSLFYSTFKTVISLFCKDSSLFKRHLWTSCSTFYPEYILQLCVALFQKGHMVWNSSSTFHQFWVKRETGWVTQDFLICSVCFLQEQHFPQIFLSVVSHLFFSRNFKHMILRY